MDKEIIDYNYKSIVARGLITKNTTMYDFVEKLFEEVREVDDVCTNSGVGIEFEITEIDKTHLVEEIADVILVALNFAKHYNLDIDKAIKNKITVNFERSFKGK